MAGTGTKRIIELTEASTIQNGDFIAVDSNARGTKKVPTSALATSAALTAETNARTGADEQMSERMDGIEEQTALIQNPTKTVSGSIAHFTDGAEMPAKSVIVNIEPQQSGTGTPSPDNVRQISGWESVNVNVAGKNLLPNKKAQVGAAQVIVGDDTASITGAQGFYLPVGTYTLLINATKTCGVYWIDKTTGGNSRVGATNTPIRINVTASGYYLALLYDGGGVAVSEVNEAQLETGTTATDYEPYIGTTTPVNLGRTVYGGTLDVVSGVLTVTHGIRALDGTEQYADYWNLSTTNRIGVYIPNSRNTEYTNFWCSHYGTYAFTALADNGIAKAQSTNLAYVIKDSANCLSVNGYKDYVAQQYANGTPITLVYELATPQTYQLTPTEVKTLLGDNNVWADSGDVEITYRRDISIVINNLESALNG